MNDEQMLATWAFYLLKLGKRWHEYATPHGGLDPEDVAQEIALRALRTMRTYDPERGAFSTWLTQVARGTASTLRAAALAKMRDRKTLSVSCRDGSNRLEEIAAPAEPCWIDYRKW